MNGRAKRFHFMDLTMYQAENSRANGQCDGKSVHFSIKEEGRSKNTSNQRMEFTRN